MARATNSGASGCHREELEERMSLVSWAGTKRVQIQTEQRETRSCTKIYISYVSLAWWTCVQCRCLCVCEIS